MRGWKVKFLKDPKIKFLYLLLINETNIFIWQYIIRT